MPDDAGQRLIDAADRPLANGVTANHVRDGLCFAAKVAVAALKSPVNAEARRKLESARNALAKYDMIMRDLDAEGLPVPSLPDGWFKQASDHIDALSRESGGKHRTNHVRTHVYPYLLALYELSFAEVPTAYYYDAQQKDGPTLSFVRQAALELDKAYAKIFARSRVTSALFGDGQRGTLFVSLPEGDSLRRALEPFIKARADIPSWFSSESNTESNEAAAYRYAHNLLKFRVFQTA